MRHHTILQTTTALTLSLSIVNGGVASAQVAGIPRQVPAAISDGAHIWLAQSNTDCSVDPAAAGCTPPETSPADGTVPSPETTISPTDPGMTVPEIAPDAEAPADDQQVAPSPADAAPSEPTTDAGTERTPPAQDQAPAPAKTADPQAGETVPENGGETAPQATGTAEPAPQATPTEEPTAPAAPETQAEPAPDESEATPAPAPADAPKQTDALPEGGQAETDAAPPPAEAAPADAPVTKDGNAPPENGQASTDAASSVTEPAPADQPVAETAPVPTAEQQAVLDSLMAKPEVASAVQTLEQAVAPVAETAAPAAAAALEGAAPQPAATSTQTITAETARSSEQDFQTKVTTAAPATAEKKSGLSDLEKAGLVALGAVAVGMMVANNRVVANSGDRVVVDQGNGNLAVWKDDDALLRQPGVVETTQRYSDGSTLTSIARGDGSTVETVRDATGRVLRREIVFPNGQRVGIIDDTRPVKPVDVSRLPKPRVPSFSLLEDTDLADLRNRLAEAQQPGLDRYSLAQVRGIAELRALAPELSPRPITFATASSAIPPEQAGRLGQLAKLMTEIIADDPRSLFLIEGHTDAVGSAAYNLALSDRRAESVALALTQVFGIPPENLVVQGYGERFLKVPSERDEPRNRRVAVRDITWLVDGS